MPGTNHYSIYELVHYETDYTHDDLPLTYGADETAQMISERVREIKTRIVENATPHLNLIKTMEPFNHLLNGANSAG